MAKVLYDIYQIKNAKSPVVGRYFARAVPTETIDTEVHQMLESAYQRAKQLLLENRDKLDQLAEQLISREVIFREDLEQIYGKRPFEEEEKELKGESSAQLPDDKPEAIAENADTPHDDSVTENDDTQQPPKI